MMAPKIVLAALSACLVSGPLAAQSRQAIAMPADPPSIALRGFAMVTGQSFTARETFEAAFERRYQSFYGGGLELALRRGPYLDVTASRFKKVGERALRVDGKNYRLGIPVTVAITPFEVTAGYRFGRSRRVVPYLGAGVGSYRYEETSAFSDPGEELDTRHTGYLAAAGAELRVIGWIRVAGDFQYTHVPGILGGGGLSKEAGERDLGGAAVRVKIVVGR